MSPDVDPERLAATEGRVLSMKVLGELAGAWAQIWDEAREIQRRNPDVMRVAVTKSPDPFDAIIELQPHLALLHPQVVASVAAFCHGVSQEFGYAADGVSPLREHPFVVAEQSQESDDGHTPTLAEALERIEALEQLVAGAGAVLASPPDPCPNADPRERLAVLETVMTGAGALLRSLTD